MRHPLENKEKTQTKMVTCMASKNVSVREVITKLTSMMGDSRAKMVSKTPESILVKPKTNEEIVLIMKLAEKHGISIIPRRRWRPSSSSSAVPQIIMDAADMNGIFNIDEDNLAVTVGPGVLWKDLCGALSKRNFSLGVYPSVATSTVGEWIDDGGAGIGSYVYGFAADQVRTMEVVLPDGKVINTGFKNVLSNSSGYNLNGLFIGADSTLGVITKITLKLYPTPEEIRPMYYTFTETRSMTKALHELTRVKATPLNISFFDQNHVKSLKLFGRDVPSLGGLTLNITLAGLISILEHDEGQIDAIMEKHGAIKEAGENAQTLWSERFFYVESKPAKLMPVFGQALVPASNLSDIIDDTHILIKKMELKGVVMGTLCDRSTVSFTPYFLLREGQLKKSRLPAVFSEKIGEIALKYEGRPTGSSILTGQNLKRIYGDGINTILDIKSALDPHNIMNPNDFA
jgi:FAD/FMN-containing dehydrogenase